MNEGRPRTNIPIDLLRTLVAVVDLSSFTKASVQLGLTQPAVSTHIKRLQCLLGAELLDRSSQRINLTPQGEAVVSYARRLLSINDQIVHIGKSDVRQAMTIRVGTSSGYVAALLPGTFAHFHERWPDVRFIVRADGDDALIRELRHGDLDVVVGLSVNPPPDAQHVMASETVWVRGPSTRLDLDMPVPLVTYGEESPFHKVAVTALQAVGLNWEAVFTGPGIASLGGAVAAGLGVLPIARKIASEIGLNVWEDTPLPKLPDLYSGVYVREGGEYTAYKQLADDIAKMLYGETRPVPKLVVDRQRKANPAA